MTDGCTISEVVGDVHRTAEIIRFSVGDVELLACPDEPIAIRERMLGKAAFSKPLWDRVLGAVMETFKGARVVEVRRACE